MSSPPGSGTGRPAAEFRRSTALPHLEARRSCQKNPCYRPHTHDSFSVGLIDTGTSILSGPINGTIRLEPGDVILIPSDQVHACNPDGGRWLYQMIHMDQGWAASLTPEGRASDLFAGITVLRRPDLHDRVAALTALVFADSTRECIETAFADMFAELEHLPPAHLVAPGSDPELLARLRPVLDRLRHDRINPPLDELASLVGMSRHQLDRAMRRATGLSPLAWRQNARVVAARHLLRDGVPIAETAYAMGFTDQSHFHRVFRAHVASTPGVYRAER